MGRHIWVVRLCRTDADEIRQQIDARCITASGAADAMMHRLRIEHLAEIAQGAYFVVEPSVMNDAGIVDEEAPGQGEP